MVLPPAMVTDRVLPTCVDLAESENSLMFKVSSPSLRRSLVRVCEKEKFPSLSTVPDPVKAPDEKSSLVIPIPDSE